MIIGVAQGDGYGFLQNRFDMESRYSSLGIGSAGNAAYGMADFQMDVDKFVGEFFNYVDKGKSAVQRLIEFMYTDWRNEYVNMLLHSLVQKHRPSGSGKPNLAVSIYIFRIQSNTLKKSLLDLYTDKEWVEPIIKTAQMQLDLDYSVYFYTLSHSAGKRLHLNVLYFRIAHNSGSKCSV